MYTALLIVVIVLGIAGIAAGAVLVVRGLGRNALGPRDADPLEFLQNRRIAFIGLSPDRRAFSAMVARELVARGYEVVPVNPRAAAAGEPGYVARVSELADPPDAALLMVPASKALEVVEDCVAAGVEAVWFHRGVGPGSASPAAVARARKAGMFVVAGTCPLMYLDGTGWLHRAHHNLVRAA